MEHLLEEKDGIIDTAKHELRPFSVSVHDYLQYFVQRFIEWEEYQELFIKRSDDLPSNDFDYCKEYFNDWKEHLLGEERNTVTPHRGLVLRGVAIGETRCAYLLETIGQVSSMLEKSGFKVSVDR